MQSKARIEFAVAGRKGEDGVYVATGVAAVLVLNGESVGAIHGESYSQARARAALFLVAAQAGRVELAESHELERIDSEGLRKEDPPKPAEEPPVDPRTDNAKDGVTGRPGKRRVVTRADGQESAT